MGQTKCNKIAENGQEVETIVYLGRGETESLIGRMETKGDGID